jgi:hypothetical protein
VDGSREVASLCGVEKAATNEKREHPIVLSAEDHLRAARAPLEGDRVNQLSETAGNAENVVLARAPR